MIKRLDKVAKNGDYNINRDKYRITIEHANSDWPMVELGEVVEILNGYAFKSEKYVNKGIRVIRITNVQRGSIVDDNPKFYPLDTKEPVEKYKLFENDFLVSLTGNVGRVGLLPKEFLPAVLNQRVACLRIKEDRLDKKFLFYLLNQHQFENACIKSARGIAQKNLSTVWLASYKIPLPSISEQKRIVEILDKADALRKKRQDANQLANKLIQSIFLEMFGDPGRNPKKYLIESIGDLIECINNEDPSKYPDKFYEYIDISSVNNVSKEIISTKRIKGTEAPSRARQIVRPNDILVSMVRPNLNAVALVPSNINCPIASTGFCVLRVKEDKIDEKYLFEICKKSFFVEKLTRIAKGASYPAVTDNDIKKILIPIPPFELQQKFADIVHKVEKIKEKQHESEKELNNLFNSLMQKVFKE